LVFSRRFPFVHDANYVLKRQGMIRNPELLGKRFRQARETAHAHPHSQIGPLLSLLRIPYAL
jgi:hypothetical protein